MAQDGTVARGSCGFGEIGMTSAIAPLALAVSTGALLALPLTPAIRELVAKRDAGPLVTRKDDGRIDNFADSLRAHSEPFEAELAQCAQMEVDQIVEHAAEKVYLCGREGSWQGPQRPDMLVLGAASVSLPAGFHCFRDFYARGSVFCGQSNIFRALLSDADIHLSAQSQVLRWTHAEGKLTASEGCTFFGRASAGEAMVLSDNCRFERIHAPVIYSSEQASKLDIRTESAPFSKLAQAGIGRKRVHGRAHLGREEQHLGDLVSLKSLHLDEGAAVFGSVKANGPIELAARSEIDGALVSTKTIHISGGCFVKGPLIAEREIVISSGAQIGLPGTPSTVSAPHIRIAPGAVLHGTVWARVEGRVGG